MHIYIYIYIYMYRYKGNDVMVEISSFYHTTMIPWWLITLALHTALQRQRVLKMRGCRGEGIPALKEPASHQDALLDLKYTVEQESLEEAEEGGREEGEMRGEKEWWLLWSLEAPVSIEWKKKFKNVSKSPPFLINVKKTKSTLQSYKWLFGV